MTVTNDATRPNVELLDKTREWIAAHPREWDQYDWASCFAAHACRQAGYEVHDDEEFPPDAYRDGVRVGTTDQVGQAVLRLTIGQAWHLFHSDQDTLEDIDYSIDLIKSGWTGDPA